MGWTFSGYYGSRPETMKEKKNFIERELKTWYNGGVSVIHSHLVADPYVGEKGGYVHYCSIEKADQRRVILVTLFVFDKYNWGYKDMSEDMGPAYYDCPLVILKDVPCPDDEWAIEWRKTVKEQHYKKNAQKAAIKALRPGDMVEFIDWNYAGQKKFEVASVEGNKILFYAASGKRVQLLHWRKAEFKIIKAN